MSKEIPWGKVMAMIQEPISLLDIMTLLPPVIGRQEGHHDTGPNSL